MRKIFAILIIVFIVFPLLAAALSVGAVAGSRILDRQFYLDLLDDERLYQAMLDEELPVRFSGEVFGDDQLPAEALGVALREVVTAEYLREQTINVVNSVFDGFEGVTPGQLAISIDLRPVKAALADGDGAATFTRALAEALPVCTSRQTPVAPQGILTRCRPAEDSVEQTAATLRENLPAALARTPDELNFSEVLTMTDDFGRSIPLSGNIIPLIRGSLWGVFATTLFFAAVFWVMAAFVATDSPRGRLLWLGSSLILPAASIFLAGLSFTGGFSAASGWMFTASTAEFSPEFMAAVRDLAVEAVNAFSQVLMITGGLTLGLSVALLLWGAVTPETTAEYRGGGATVSIPNKRKVG